MISIERVDRVMASARKAVREACPRAEGVIIGQLHDRATWHAILPDDATGEERAAAAQALADVDLDAPTADDVNAEKLRRQMAVYGVDSHQALTDARTDDAEQSTRIMLQVTDPTAVADAFRSIWSRQDAFKRFEAAAARLKALPRIPDDFRSDQHWS